MAHLHHSHLFHHFPDSQKTSLSHTLQEIIPARSRMRNHALICAIFVKDYTIRAGTASGINFIGAQDGELIVGPSIRKPEALVIAVCVRILAAAHGLRGFEVVAALLNGGVDVAGVVAGRAAFIDALALGWYQGWMTEKREGNRLGREGWPGQER